MSVATAHAHHKRAHDLLAPEMLESAQRLFLLSDTERKGYILKRDMQRMSSEVPLTPEQLETVFDSLDAKGNGSLTIEQFLEGFAQYLSSHAATMGGAARSSEPSPPPPRVLGSGPSSCLGSGSDADDDVEDSGISLQTQDGDADADAEDEPLQDLLQQLNAVGLQGVETVRAVWRGARVEGGARLQAHVETLLQNVARELRRRQRDLAHLERTIDKHRHDHNQQIQRLFEEMETQFIEDRDKIIRQGEEKLRQSRRSLEEELSRKNKLLQKALDEHNLLTEQLQAARLGESAVKDEQARVFRSKEELEVRVAQQCRELLGLRQRLEEAKRAEEEDRKRNLRQGFRLAKGLMLEQQGLLQQLQLIRGMVATLDEDYSTKAWRSAEEKSSRLRDISFTSFETTSGALDDYEYDEDYCHPVFQRTELVRNSGTQTALSYSSGTSSLHEELESSKSSECEYSTLQKVL